jgi:hypothetical protein
MPAHLAAWWRAHPERWRQRPRYQHRFPTDGSLRKQVQWFCREFLKLADKASSTKERGDFLRLAFMATLKGEHARGSDDAMVQYAEFRKREDQRAEEARAPREAVIMRDDRDDEILRYFQNTTYRKRDPETQD